MTSVFNFDDIDERAFTVTVPKKGDILGIYVTQDNDEPGYIKIRNIMNHSPWYSELPTEYHSDVYITRFAGCTAPNTVRRWKEFFKEQQSPFAETKTTMKLWKRRNQQRRL